MNRIPFPVMLLMSRILIIRTLLWGGLLAVLLQIMACGTTSRQGIADKYLNYKVRGGDTLYSIAWRYGYDPREVAAWNGLDKPYTIYPGQPLVIIAPHQSSRRTPPPSASQPETVATSTPNSVASAGVKTVAKPPPTRRFVPPTQRETAGGGARRGNGAKPVAEITRTIVWGWPTKGAIVERFDPSSGSKGLDIGGRIGQLIHSAASGKIVYSGKGLIGYGNLIIIKHDDIYLSAYGHNSRLLVKEGEKVEKGQLIAHMGNSNGGKPLLHFEIRKKGKPINPMWYLPK